MDAILYWNDVANEANKVAHSTTDARDEGARGPCGSSRAYAIVHLAMHDAFVGTQAVPPYDRYLGVPPAPIAGSDTDAAIASAAYTTLRALYPAQHALFDEKLAEAGLTAGTPGYMSGRAFGVAVADAILARRQNDPSTSGAGHVGSTQPGRHRHDPDAPPQEHGYHAPFYGAPSTLFATTHRFRLAKPPVPGDADYTAALEEVRGKGIATHLMATIPFDPAKGGPRYPLRTPSETLVGLYWGYDGANQLGTPPRLYNQIVRTIAEAKNIGPDSLARNARLFAVVNAAMGDAGILAWDDKFYHDLWRPVLGIREFDPTLGPAGAGDAATKVLADEADPWWLPLGAPRTNGTKKNFTPPFPAYPSGHATFGAAAFQSVRQFYSPGIADGPDDLVDGMEFVSDELDGNSADNSGAVRPRHARSFQDGLWQMIEENGRSRVYLGVHWVFDAFAVDNAGNVDLSQNIGGARLGVDIANDIATKGLKASQGAGPKPR